FQAEDGIRDFHVTGVQTCALPIWLLSSAVMTVVPAKVAGVAEVIVATPCRPDGTVDPYVLVAAVEAGADRILKVGGAQAIAALEIGRASCRERRSICGVAGCVGAS